MEEEEKSTIADYLDVKFGKTKVKEPKEEETKDPELKASEDMADYINEKFPK